jgi:hypothetical protein
MYVDIVELNVVILGVVILGVVKIGVFELRVVELGVVELGVVELGVVELRVVELGADEVEIVFNIFYFRDSEPTRADAGIPEDAAATSGHQQGHALRPAPGLDEQNREKP